MRHERRQFTADRREAVHHRAVGGKQIKRVAQPMSSTIGAFNRRALRAPVIRRRLGVGAAARRDEFARKLVERLVRGEARPNPFVEGPRCPALRARYFMSFF